MTAETPSREYGWHFFDTLMAQHGKTKIDNNTYLERRLADGRLLYAVVLHGEPIIVLDRQARTAVLTSAGWRTPLTRRRLNTYLAGFGWRVHESAVGAWWLVREDALEVDERRFVDGMEVAL